MSSLLQYSMWLIGSDAFTALSCYLSPPPILSSHWPDGPHFIFRYQITISGCCLVISGSCWHDAFSHTHRKRIHTSHQSLAAAVVIRTALCFITDVFLPLFSCDLETPPPSCCQTLDLIYSQPHIPVPLFSTVVMLMIQTGDSLSTTAGIYVRMKSISEWLSQTSSF